jgi:hypothetical protein
MAADSFSRNEFHFMEPEKEHGKREEGCTSRFMLES